MTKRNKASKDKTKQSILERSAEEVEVKIRARQVYKTVSLCTISMLKSTTVLFYNTFRSYNEGENPVFSMI